MENIFTFVMITVMMSTARTAIVCLLTVFVLFFLTVTVYALADGSSWTEVGSGSLPQGMTGQATIVYNNQLWIVGGYNGSTVSQKVYHSSDGQQWIESGIDTLPKALDTPRSAVYDGKMWIFGGWDGDWNQSFSVYSSSDGVIWTEAGVQSLPMNPVQVIMHDQMLWIIGGLDDLYNLTPRVYFSTDGVSWTQAGVNALPSSVGDNFTALSTNPYPRL